LCPLTKAITKGKGTGRTMMRRLVRVACAHASPASANFSNRPNPWTSTSPGAVLAKSYTCCKSTLSEGWLEVTWGARKSAASGLIVLGLHKALECHGFLQRRKLLQDQIHVFNAKEKFLTWSGLMSSDRCMKRFGPRSPPLLELMNTKTGQDGMA